MFMILIMRSVVRRERGRKGVGGMEHTNPLKSKAIFFPKLPIMIQLNSIDY